MLSAYKEVRVIDMRSNNGFLELEFQMNIDEPNKITRRSFETEDFRV
ncbi:MAG: hypothetical protein ACP5NC_03765 [Nitrososphaeria archaeon]